MGTVTLAQEKFVKFSQIKKPVLVEIEKSNELHLCFVELVFLLILFM